MSQDMLVMLISALTTYACFEKRTLSYNIQQCLMERNTSMTFYDVLQKEWLCEILSLRVWCGDYKRPRNQLI